MVGITEDWNMLPGEVVIRDEKPKQNCMVICKKPSVQQVVMTNYRLLAKKTNFMDCLGIPLICGCVNNEYIQTYWSDVTACRVGPGTRKWVPFFVWLFASVVFLGAGLAMSLSSNSFNNSTAQDVTKFAPILFGLAAFALLFAVGLYLRRPSVVQFYVQAVDGSADSFQIKGPRDKCILIWKTWHEIVAPVKTQEIMRATTGQASAMRKIQSGQQTAVNSYNGHAEMQV
ncbi:hypothetical protein HDU86_008419 [Geranomyces michiganensis]|nr:hypothetical protein HDU86_008419 [Geranomyces michiganensis]